MMVEGDLPMEVDRNQADLTGLDGPEPRAREGSSDTESDSGDEMAVALPRDGIEVADYEPSESEDETSVGRPRKRQGCPGERGLRLRVQRGGRRRGGRAGRIQPSLGRRARLTPREEGRLKDRRSSEVQVDRARCKYRPTKRQSSEVQGDRARYTLPLPRLR